jgi:hypothetical protein
MRTTIDLPDALFRKTKAKAALQGSSMKDLIVRALEHEVGQVTAAERAAIEKTRDARLKLPVVPWKGKKKLDLSDFDFDDLLP